MVMLNDLDRFHLVMDVIDRVPGPRASAGQPAAGDGRRTAAAPARGRASTARTPGDLAAGSGRTERVGDVLVVNAGSTSLKLHLVEDDESATGRRRSRRSTPATSMRSAIGSCTAVRAFVEPVLVDADGAPGDRRPRAARARCTTRPALAALDDAGDASRRAPRRRLRHRVPRAPCRPRRASTPCRGAWRDEWGVRRYGFHGLSVAWCVGARRRSCSAGQGGSPPGRVPPRRRLLGDGGRRRTLRATRRWASRRSRASR